MFPSRVRILFKFVWSYPLGAKTVFADLNSAAAKNGPTSVPADYVLLTQGYLSAPLVRTSGYGADNPISNNIY